MEGGYTGDAGKSPAGDIPPEPKSGIRLGVTMTIRYPLPPALLLALAALMASATFSSGAAIRPARRGGVGSAQGTRLTAET